MKTQIIALAAGVVIAGLTAAEAQTADKTSLVDHNRSAALAGSGTTYSPGTVGAMNAVAHGVATSAEDVGRQQQGRSSASDGDRVLVERGAMAVGGGSPGTVGATPGY